MSEFDSLVPAIDLCPLCKERVRGARNDKGHFLPQRGRAHSTICPNWSTDGLLFECSQQNDSKHLFDNLTATQHRCTALIQEVHALKWLNTSSPIETRIVADAVYERRRQDQKWGPLDEKSVDMPDGTGEQWNLALHKAREANADGTESFLSILREEVYEAAVETTQEGLRAELVQVAAVALKWIAAIDMRKSRTESRLRTPQSETQLHGINLGGWWCGACGGYNGPGRKEPSCRACDARRPNSHEQVARSDRAQPTQE